VSGLADGLHPSVLRLIRNVTEAAAARGKWVGVCGELGSDPEAVPLLVGLGVSELSVNPPAIPATKEAVRDVDAGAAAALADEALALDSAEDVRALVTGAAALPSESLTP
jgi:phosphoenolpyruvate-protein kinase (PTS system EI component)